MIVPSENAPPTAIIGAGAASPAGWGIQSLLAAIQSGEELPSTPSERPGGDRPWACSARRVPPLPAGLLPRSPRLRRSSNITKLAMGAAVEALADAGHTQPPQGARLGLILCVMNGCVDFTGRFFNEVLDTPTLASPILFPETVFNAPASHVAQCLGIDGPVSTLIGEPTNLAEGLRMATTWLDAELIDQCLVIAAEEHNWLSSEAVGYYHCDLIASEGAAAFVLAPTGRGPRLSSLTGPFPFIGPSERSTALQELVASLSTSPPNAVLIDGRCGIPSLDQLEFDTWAGRSPDQVWSPKKLLGESMGASMGLQLALAVEVARSLARPALVSSPGYNAAAYGAIVSPAS